MLNVGGDPCQQLVMLLSQGRSMGVRFFCNNEENYIQAVIELSRKLGELGFDRNQSLSMISNCYSSKPPLVFSLFAKLKSIFWSRRLIAH
jgi:hypothetical protein